MFARFRQIRHRLQVSLIEGRRVDGKVRHEHIASLGSIEIPPTVPARIAFWQRLHERLAKLGNRVDSATQGKLLGAIHARVPMVTADEQRALQLENTEAEARFWSSMHDMSAGQVESHKGFVAVAERKIADGQSAAADAAAKAAVAKERIERIKKGENVEGGLGKPLTREDFERIMRDAGMTASDIRDCEHMATVCDAFGFEMVHKAIFDAQQRAEKRARRAMMRTLLRKVDESHGG